MKFRSLTSLAIILGLTSFSAHAQTPPGAAAFESSLQTIISIFSFGTISLQDQHVTITPKGSDYEVKMPLAALAPPDNTLDITGHTQEDGIVAITSMRFPSKGTIVSQPHGGPPSRIRYEIAHQSVSGRVDPSLKTQSALTFGMDGARLWSQAGHATVEEDVGRYQGNETLDQAADGRLAAQVDGSAGDFRFMVRNAGPRGFDFGIQSMTFGGSAEGIDRAHVAQVTTAFRTLQADMPPPPGLAHPPGKPPPLSPRQKRALIGVVDALSGLADRIEVHETLKHVGFSAGQAVGTVQRVRLDMGGHAMADRLSAHWMMAMQGMSLPVGQPDLAPLVPHNVRINLTMRNVDSARFRALMRESIAQSVPAPVLRAQWLALMTDPAAKVGIRTLSFDSGPLKVVGSARLLPGPNGQPVVEAHISATGLDALMAQVQTMPAERRTLPALYMMKGMARPDGKSLAWDIRFGDGIVRINGTPLGQPPAPRR